MSISREDHERIQEARKDAREKAALFPDATPEKRAHVLMCAGRIDVESKPYVVAHIEQAVATATADLRKEVEWLRLVCRSVFLNDFGESIDGKWAYWSAPNGKGLSRMAYVVAPKTENGIPIETPELRAALEAALQPPAAKGGRA